MKISLNWLSHFCDISDKYDSPESRTNLAHIYSVKTAEVDDVIVHDISDKIVIGKVVSTESHPDADKLTVVQVDVGDHGQRQIVCGANNIIGSTYVPVALEGCDFGEGFVIEKRKLRGVESCGMICSTDELGIEADRAPGIWRLDEECSEKFLDAHLGSWLGYVALTLRSSKDQTYPIVDTVFDLDNKFITNRPDLFGVYGNAREMSAIFSQSLNTSSNVDITSTDGLFDIQTPLCTGYSLHKIDGVTSSMSPLVIRSLVSRSGHSCRNILVDLTNFVSTEMAQPMHSFDADCVSGKIVIKELEESQKFEALDGNTYELEEGDLVISDDNEVLALAGIIGGMKSSVTDNTTSVLVESACFDSVRVRTTSQRLGLRTDASMRFEKGQDMYNISSSQERYWDILSSYMPDAVSQGMQLSIQEQNPTTISISHSYLETKIGANLESNNVLSILDGLSFETKKQDDLYSIVIPSWRATGDVSIKEDIVEEIARMYGYDTLVSTPLDIQTRVTNKDLQLDREAKLSAYFSSKGLYDAYTYTFTTPQKAKLFASTMPVITQPMSQDQSVLRTHVLDSLLDLCKKHYRQYSQFGFFESGRAFPDNVEVQQSVGVLYGHTTEDVKSILDGYMNTSFPNTHASYVQSCYEKHAHILHPNKAATIQLDNTDIISFGYLHPSLALEYGLDASKVIVFEILDPSFVPETKNLFTPLHKFPVIDREINFVFDAKKPASEVISLISDSHNWIQDNIRVVDIFTDPEKIGEGKQSMTFSYTIRKSDGSITDEEASIVQKSIIDNLSAHSIMLR